MTAAPPAAGAPLPWLFLAYFGAFVLGFAAAAVALAVLAMRAAWRRLRYGSADSPRPQAGPDTVTL